MLVVRQSKGALTLPGTIYRGYDKICSMASDSVSTCFSNEIKCKMITHPAVYSLVELNANRVDLFAALKYKAALSFILS